MRRIQRQQRQALAVSIVAVARCCVIPMPSCSAFSSTAASSSPADHAASNLLAGSTSFFSPSNNHEEESSRPNTFHVFPVEFWDKRHELLSDYDQVKLLHVVRHAQGTHNVDQNYRDESNLDARLTELGHEQCAALARQVSDLAVDLIVTSPLTRCVQTALYSFPQHSTVNVIAHESLRETVNFKCDQRRTISEISSEFGQHVDFSTCSIDEGYIWNAYEAQLGPDFDDHREGAELHMIAERGRNFWQWLQSRPEPQAVICTHSAFLRCLWSWGHPGGVPRRVPQRPVLSTLLGPDQDIFSRHPPVVQYPRKEGDADHIAFEEWMRSDYDNAEMRSFVMAFPHQSQKIEKS